MVASKFARFERIRLQRVVNTATENVQKRSLDDGTDEWLISASLVRHSLLHFLLSHMAVHHLHHLHYHRLHLLLILQYFILNSRLGSSANPFLHRHFPFLLD